MTNYEQKWDPTESYRSKIVFMNLAHKRTAAEGDFVFLYERKDSIIPVFLKHGEKYQCILGAFLHDDMIGKEFGSIVKCGVISFFCRLLHKQGIGIFICCAQQPRCGLLQ